MITVIRQYFKKSSQVLLWVVVGAFIIGLLPMAYRQIAEGPSWAVRVNGQEIAFSQYAMELERKKEFILALRQQYGQYADYILGGIDPQMLAVQSLEREELLNQVADKFGMYMADAYVAQKLNDSTFVRQELGDLIPQQMVDPITGIDQQMLARYLKHFKLSPDMFERQIERFLMEKLVTEMVESSFYLPEFDVKQKLVSGYAKKSFSTLRLSIDPLIEAQKKKDVDNKQLKAFYDEQNLAQRAYLVPEKRSGQIWTFDPKSYQIVVTDAQVEQYYENNKVKKYIDKPSQVEVRRILFAVSDPDKKATVQEKAAQIKDELIKDPTQFAAFARKYSDDSQSASNGGLLKPFTRGTHEAAFDRAAFILSKDGAISDVIETADGFQIIQRERKTLQTFKPLSAVKKEIEQQLQTQKFERQFIADVRAVLENEESFASFVSAKGGKSKSIESVELDQTPLSQHLFRIREGERTFYVDGKQGVAVRLDKIEEKFTPSFEAIKQTVLEDYQQAEAKKELDRIVAEAKNMLSSTSMKEVKTKLGGIFDQTALISSDSQSEIESLKEKNVPAVQMLQMEKVGAVSSWPTAEGAVVVRLDQIAPLESSFLKEKMGEVAQQLERERTAQYLEAFVASLFRNAKIETNESVITLQS